MKNTVKLQKNGSDVYPVVRVEDIIGLNSETAITQKDLDDLKKYFLTALKNYQMKSAEDILKDVKAGGDIALVEDLESGAGFTITKDANIDFGGNEMKSVNGVTYGDSFVMGNGADITLSNGVINKSQNNATLENASATIHFKSSIESHLTLNNMTVTGVYPIYINNSAVGSTVTINSGTFYSEYENNPVVFCNKYGTKVTINGGRFGQRGLHGGYLLNILDSLRTPNTEHTPREFIEVFGGEFWNFNPMDNKSEGEGTNYVADGYTVVAEQFDDDTLYKVVKIKSEDEPEDAGIVESFDNYELK